MLCYCVPPPTSMGLYSSLISGGKEKIFPLFLRMEKERSLKILFVSHKFPFKPFLGGFGGLYTPDILEEYPPYPHYIYSPDCNIVETCQ